MHKRNIQKTRTINKKESQTQYVTRFGNLLTSSGQGRDFIDSTANTSFPKGYNSWGSTPLSIAKESQSFKKPQLDSTHFQIRSPNLRSSFACQSTRPVDQPLPSVDRYQQKVHVRAVNLSPCYGRPGDRSSCAYARCAHQSTGRSATILVCKSTIFSLLWTPIFALFLSMS